MQLAPTKPRAYQAHAAQASRLPNPRLANLVPRNSQLPSCNHQTRASPLTDNSSQLPNPRLPTRIYETRAYQTRAYQTRTTQIAPTKPAPRNSRLPNPRLANLAPTKPRTYQTHAYQIRATQLAPPKPHAYQAHAVQASRLPNPRLANLVPRNSQLPSRNHQTRASPLTDNSSQLPNPRLPTRIYESRAYQVGPTNSCYHLTPRISRPCATKFKSRDSPLRKSKPWPTTTQDPPLPKLKPS
jgi:hypothetical protein